jgi:hypothetical protein
MIEAAVAHKTPAVPIVVATGAEIVAVIADAAVVGAGAVVVVAAAAVAVPTTVRATLLLSRTPDRGAIFLLPNTLRHPVNRAAMTVAAIAGATVALSPEILNLKAATIVVTSSAATRIAETAAVTVAAPHAALNRAVVNRAAKALGRVRLPLLTIQPKNRSCCPVNLSPNIAASRKPLPLLRRWNMPRTMSHRTSKIFCRIAP